MNKDIYIYIMHHTSMNADVFIFCVILHLIRLVRLLMPTKICVYICVCVRV